MFTANPQLGTVGTPIHFTDQSYANIVSWNWDFGDGTRGTGATPSHTYTAYGTYTVTLVVTDSRGAASAPAQATATIANIPPTVSAGANARMLPGIFTLSASFSDPGVNDTWTYVIDWGDGVSTTGSTNRAGAITASHPYLAPAVYKVTVTVTDKDGGVGSGSATVTVTLTP